MVKMIAPKYSYLAPDLVKSYKPSEDNLKMWHTVVNGQIESFLTIARKHDIPVERLIEFNFPGSVIDGKIVPSIVNWYLFHHVRTRCRHVTRDGQNYMFKGGEKIAIPHLGRVEIGEPKFLAPTNTKFKIKQHANLEISKLIAADFSIFQIWDQDAAKCSFYTYWASGISKSLTPGWLSATTAGDWSNLVVTKAIAVNQFTGPTRFTTVSAGNTSRNFINFMGLPPDTKTIPNPLPISTGFTYGIGGGSTIGQMKLELLGTPDGLLPFEGPE
jgi:hypothetical protein